MSEFGQEIKTENEVFGNDEDTTFEPIFIQTSQLTATNYVKKKCKEDNKCLNAENDISKHTSIVITDKKLPSYKCPKCNYESVFKLYLTNHIKSVHEKSNPFKCLECNYESSNEFYFFNHVKSVHKKLERSKTFKSSFLNFESLQKPNVSPHISTVHKKLKLFSCNTTYDYSSDLIRNVNCHFQEVQKNLINRPTFNCMICKSLFSTKTLLLRHINLVHEKQKTDKCQSGESSFSTKEKLSQHTNLLVQEKLPSCPSEESTSGIKQEFKTDDELFGNDQITKLEPSLNKTSVCVTTINSVQNSKSHEINEDNQCFNSENHLKKHIVTPDEKITLYKCPKCNYESVFKYYLSNHIKSVHEKSKPFKCRKCNYESSIKSYLSNHIKSVHKCDYSSTKRVNVNRHIRTVHKRLIKPFKCKGCKSSFKTEAILSEHIYLVHENQKPLECKRCEFWTFNNYILQVHKKVHRKKKFKCQRCTYSYTTLAKLSQHINSAHEKQRPFQCQSCDYSSCLAFDLKKHVKTFHEKVKEFKCHICDYSSSLTYHLSNHIKIKHGNVYAFEGLLNISELEPDNTNSVQIPESNKCNECKKSFKSIRCLKNHMRAHEKLSNFVKEWKFRRLDL